MKNLKIVSLVLFCIIFSSCKNNEGKKIVVAAVPTHIECYKAIYRQDTLNLKINTLKDGTITGSMEMIVLKLPKKNGEISGKFRGDTLFASYTFTEGADKKITYKNPMAFLKSGAELILGNGEIETTLGASYFVKGKPIDFNQVKYKFIPVDCVK